ncbi:RdgB/HAM1 family non-canonical purine NTP pyrophosphatase [Candidatus Woesebacteria bacterium]|nr:RdgB/HAM1 family non-canonical purine NTP pyrophosphatase [Candidatus Woesebacteria bacterium]
MKLFVGTTNPGKQREISALFLDTLIEVVFPQEIPAALELDVAETGSTFAENAYIKAQAYAQCTQLLTVADDSGLEILNLDGFPGVQSNRWHTGTSQERVRALLKKVEGSTERRARFVTVVCLVDPQSEKPQYFQGEIMGTLAETTRGAEEEGFEYDFIFIPDGETRTFAELGREWKIAHSHRTRAFLQLKQTLVASLSQ